MRKPIRGLTKARFYYKFKCPCNFSGTVPRYISITAAKLDFWYARESPRLQYLLQTFSSLNLAFGALTWTQSNWSYDLTNCTFFFQLPPKTAPKKNYQTIDVMQFCKLTPTFRRSLINHNHVSVTHSRKNCTSETQIIILFLRIRHCNSHDYKRLLQPSEIRRFFDSENKGCVFVQKNWQICIKDAPHAPQKSVILLLFCMTLPIKKTLK